MTPIKEYEDFSNYLNDIVFFEVTKKNVGNKKSDPIHLDYAIVSQSENCLEDFFIIKNCFDSIVFTHEIEESNLEHKAYKIRRATFKECYKLFNDVKIKKDDNLEGFDKLDKIVQKYFSCVSFMFGRSDEKSIISSLPFDVVNTILKIAAEPS